MAQDCPWHEHSFRTPITLNSDNKRNLHGPDFFSALDLESLWQLKTVCWYRLALLCYSWPAGYARPIGVPHLASLISLVGAGYLGSPAYSLKPSLRGGLFVITINIGENETELGEAVSQPSLYHL